MKAHNVGVVSEARCMCKDRAFSACPGEWEPGCDLGKNAAYVQVAKVKINSRRGEFAIHHCKRPALECGKFVTLVEDRDVEVLARAKGYAMVRRKGCMPYVVSVRDLIPLADEFSGVPLPIQQWVTPNDKVEQQKE